MSVVIKAQYPAQAKRETNLRYDENNFQGWVGSAISLTLIFRRCFDL